VSQTKIVQVSSEHINNKNNIRILLIYMLCLLVYKEMIISHSLF